MKILSLTSKILFIVLMLSPFAYAQEAPEPIFNQNVSYQYNFEFKYSSPDSWYGAVQVNDPITGQALYRLFPPTARALFIKYQKDDMQKLQRTFNPIVEVQLYQNTDASTASSFLSKYTAKIDSSRFTLKQEAEVISGKEWYKCEFKISDSGLNLRRKLYAVSYQNLMLLLQITTTEEEYNVDIRSFDDSVTRMWFKDGKTAAKGQVATKPILNIQKSNAKIFYLKNGKSTKGEVVFESDTYFRVKKVDGSEEVIFKSDLVL